MLTTKRHPDGDSRHPDGDSRHPDGDSRHPDGDSRHPDGDSRHPERSEGSPASLADYTNQLDIGYLPATIQLTKTVVTNADIQASGKRGSAVLMLFSSPRDHSRGEASQLVFIKRSTLVRTHKGQISFPGGRSEQSDESPEQTAVRETAEEIGVNPSDIVIFGQLPAVPALDGSMVVPVAGAIRGTAVFTPNPEEVDYVFTAPWTDFRITAGSSFSFNMFGQRRTSWLFDSAGHRIWGLTAGILASAALA
jgi:8-oxo-dGTP pyrophosphatase MutT (NUDIX family)